MQDRAEATKERILQAAFREFATFGVAGARIDRISSSAGANKRAIYEYFGNKNELFDIVLVDSLQRSAAQIPASWDDLPQYVSDIYDFFVLEPDRMRLNLWRQLERPQPAEGEVEFYRWCIASLSEARPDLTEAQVTDLYAVVWSIHHSWFLAPYALQEAEGGGRWASDRLAQHRHAMVEAVRRIVSNSAGPPAA